MIKVGIIGCGSIADAHAFELSMLPDCEIVAACDLEGLLAKQLCDRFNIKRSFNNVHQMLEQAKPDVVHITTSPQSHFELSKACLEAGCHAYVEKPFTIDTTEAEQLIQLALQKNLKLTVGHDQQFTHVARAMRELIKSGYLGGLPVHIENYYGYELGGQYAKAVLGDKRHWLRNLPGQLVQNNISHGISKIAEFLAGEDAQVIAHGFTSAFLRGINETQIIDELRAIIIDNNKTTAFFTFSTQMKPALRELRIFGPSNGVMIDLNQEALITLSGRTYQSYLARTVPLYNFSKQYRKNIWKNAKLFLKRDFHMKSGLRYLIKEFYDAIMNDSPLPIPYREILLTSRIMDSIFAQVYQKRN